MRLLRLDWSCARGTWGMSMLLLATCGPAKEPQAPVAAVQVDAPPAATRELTFAYLRLLPVKGISRNILPPEVVKLEANEVLVGGILEVRNPAGGSAVFDPGCVELHSKTGRRIPVWFEVDRRTREPLRDSGVVTTHRASAPTVSTLPPRTRSSSVSAPTGTSSPSAVEPSRFPSSIRRTRTATASPGKRIGVRSSRRTASSPATAVA